MLSSELVVTENSTGLEVSNGLPDDVPAFASADNCALTLSGLELRDGNTVLWDSGTIVPVGSRLVFNTDGHINILDAEDICYMATSAANI